MNGKCLCTCETCTPPQGTLWGFPGSLKGKGIPERSLDNWGLMLMRVLENQMLVRFCTTMWGMLVIQNPSHFNTAQQRSQHIIIKYKNGNLLEERRGEEAFIGNILQYPDGQICTHRSGGNKHIHQLLVHSLVNIMLVTDILNSWDLKETKASSS